MNTGGEAADQVVKMSLNGAEVALRVSGVAAKEVATILYSLLKDNQKSKGRTRLENLIKTGKPLTIFTVKADDYEQFKSEAKRYGILYCSIRNAKDDPDGMIDIMVKQEDSTRINRIVERFKFADVSQSAQIKSDIERTRASKKDKQPLDKDVQAKDTNEKIMEDILKAPMQKEENVSNPDIAKTTKSRQSEPTSTHIVGDPKLPKPSVRKELNKIKVEMDKEAKSKVIDEKQKVQTNKPIEHQQPKPKKKSKER